MAFIILIFVIIKTLVIITEALINLYPPLYALIHRILIVDKLYSLALVACLKHLNRTILPQRLLFMIDRNVARVATTQCPQPCALTIGRKVDI